MANSAATKAAVARRCRIVRKVLYGDAHGSQARMADRLDIPRSLWNGIEHAKSIPSEELLERLFMETGITQDYILGGRLSSTAKAIELKQAEAREGAPVAANGN